MGTSRSPLERLIVDEVDDPAERLAWLFTLRAIVALPEYRARSRESGGQ
jgi:hypothetical protein